jgi:Protein of unknown function (DUF3866)
VRDRRVLSLRRGVVVLAAPPEHGWQRLEVDAGTVRPAGADVALVGEARPGDEVVVNVAAVELGLGSGGFDVVHVNLTRGLDRPPSTSAHVLKQNYTSLQHAVDPVETMELAVPLGAPVAVLPLHGHLPLVAWGFHRVAPGGRLGYVQTGGGALPGAISAVVAELRERGLLAGHVTAGPAHGGEIEAITTAGAIHHALTHARWDAVVAGPGPGILGTASALGHGGIAALETAHTALALGARALISPRMSSGDPRPRHRGLSHHTRTVLDLLLRPVTVGAPPGERREDRHEWREAEPDLDGYRTSGLPARTMGRSVEEDPLFFAAGLAAGRVLADMVRAR